MTTIKNKLSSIFGISVLFFLSLLNTQALCETALTLDNEDTIEVEIDIFSGRMNPSFFLFPEDSEFLSVKDKINEAIGDTGENISSFDYSDDNIPKLGYRGVIIKKIDSQDGHTDYISINNGRIKVIEDRYGTTDFATQSDTYCTIAKDPNQNIENYLIDLAVEKGVIERELLN